MRYIVDRKIHYLYEHPAYSEALCGRKLKDIWTTTKNIEKVNCIRCLKLIAQQNVKSINTENIEIKRGL